MKKILAVIPARYGSTRLPAKPLVKIAGKPMLQWVIEGIKQSSLLSEIKVATDHPEIFQLAQSCQVTPVMTSSELPSGTDRVYAAALNSDAEIVLNIQGDEPLVDQKVIQALVEPFLQDSGLEMSTLSQDLKLPELPQESVVKVLLNKKREAIYFSRFPIPYSREAEIKEPLECEKHLGFYAFKKEFLARFCTHPVTTLERAESLEQLRALYMGTKIRVKKIEGQFVSVDLLEHVAEVEKLLRTQ